LIPHLPKVAKHALLLQIDGGNKMLVLAVLPKVIST
jgi:hypothetical protein